MKSQNTIIKIILGLTILLSQYAHGFEFSERPKLDLSRYQSVNASGKAEMLEKKMVEIENHLSKLTRFRNILVSYADGKNITYSKNYTEMTVGFTLATVAAYFGSKYAKSTVAKKAAMGLAAGSSISAFAFISNGVLDNRFTDEAFIEWIVDQNLDETQVTLVYELLSEEIQESKNDLRTIRLLQTRLIAEKFKKDN